MTDTPTTPWPTLPDGRMLVLRTCDAQMRSEHTPAFVWPTSGPVEAPDWDPDPDRDCGGGLHGLLWGCGDASMLSSSSTVRWLVVAVDPADIANPDAPGKVRFRAGEVVLVTTDRAEAVAHLEANGAALLPTVYGTSTSGRGGTSISGYRGTSTSGHRGTSTSGDRGTSISGHGGTSISGDHGTSTSGHRGTSTSGDCGTSISGDHGTSTSGHGGTSTSGDRGTSISGDCGTSISGDCGTSTSGDYGTSTSGRGGTSTSGHGGTSISGDCGTSTSGDGGIVVVGWWDGKAARLRLTVGYVGEDGIEANTTYRCSASGVLEAVRS